MPSTSTTVFGKTILFGEHAVVYGYPAIAVPLDSIAFNIKLGARPNKKDSIIINEALGENLLLENLKPDHAYRTAISAILRSLKVKNLPALEIRISSTIPISSGLGSSAAFAVCLVKAVSGFLGFNLTDEKVSDIAYQIEVFQHGTPSGIDNSVVAFNKPVFFKKGYPPLFLKIRNPLTLVIADTGIRSTTKETVAQVRIYKESNPSIADKLLEEIGDIVDHAKQELENGNSKALGKLMAENHTLLQKLGVSGKELDQLVEVSLEQGAFGAKLCGSGKGGNIIAICDDSHADLIKSALLLNGAIHCFISKINANTKES
jgi:mevalonate kinase